MPNVTLTTFVDFVSATGPARVTRVRDAKSFYAQGYAPERDFYKQLRERIEECLDNGWDAQALKRSLRNVSDTKKIENYEECRKGLTKWRAARRSVRSRRSVQIGSAAHSTWRSIPSCTPT